MKRFVYFVSVILGLTLMGYTPADGQDVGFDTKPQAKAPVIPLVVVPPAPAGQPARLIKLKIEGQPTKGLFPGVESVQTFSDGQKMRWTFTIFNKTSNRGGGNIFPAKIFLADDEGNTFPILGIQYETTDHNGAGLKFFTMRHPQGTKVKYWVDFEAPKEPVSHFTAHIGADDGLGGDLFGGLGITLTESIPETPKSEPPVKSPLVDAAPAEPATPSSAAPVTPAITQPAEVYIGTAQKKPTTSSVTFVILDDKDGIIKAEIESKDYPAIEGEAVGRKLAKGGYAFVAMDGTTLRLTPLHSNPETLLGSDSEGWFYTISKRKPAPAGKPKSSSRNK